MEGNTLCGMMQLAWHFVVTMDQLNALTQGFPPPNTVAYQMLQIPLWRKLLLSRELDLVEG